MEQLLRNILTFLNEYEKWQREERENYGNYEERKEMMYTIRDILEDDDVKKIKLTSLSDLTVEQGLQHGLDYQIERSFKKMKEIFENAIQDKNHSRLVGTKAYHLFMSYYKQLLRLLRNKKEELLLSNQKKLEKLEKQIRVNNREQYKINQKIALIETYVARAENAMADIDFGSDKWETMQNRLEEQNEKLDEAKMLLYDLRDEESIMQQTKQEIEELINDYKRKIGTATVDDTRPNETSALNLRF